MNRLGLETITGVELSAKFAPDSVASIKVKAEGLNNDLHASPEYRAHLITVMARRAVAAANA